MREKGAFPLSLFTPHYFFFIISHSLFTCQEIRKKKPLLKNNKFSQFFRIVIGKF